MAAADLQVVQKTHHDNREYEEYRRSPRWEKLRRVVQLRAVGGRCEVCLRRQGTEVAHLSYDRIFRELPYDVLWVCARCHRAIDDRGVRAVPPR